MGVVSECCCKEVYILSTVLWIHRVAAGIVSQMVLWVITSSVTVYACN